MGKKEESDKKIEAKNDEKQTMGSQETQNHSEKKTENESEEELDGTQEDDIATKSPNMTEFYNFSFLNNAFKMLTRKLYYFKKFLIDELQINEINDQFLENRSLVGYVKKLIEYMNKDKRLMESTKISYIVVLKKFFLALIQENYVKIDKKYVSICFEKLEKYIEDDIQKKKSLKLEKKNEENEKNEEKLKFSFFVHLREFHLQKANIFFNYLFHELKIKEINEKYLESESLVEHVNKYIEYMKKKKIKLVSKKANYLGIKKYFSKIIKKSKNINKKYLKVVVEQLKNLCEFSEKKIVKKTEKKEKKKFSFSFRSIGVKKEFFNSFEKFVVFETKIDEIDDKFLQSPSLLECTKKYIDFINDYYYINGLLSIFSIMSTKNDFKINKKYLNSSIEELEKISSKKSRKKYVKNLSGKKLKRHNERINFSFSFESAEIKKEFFNYFLNFLLYHTNLNDINDQFLASESLVEYTNRFIDYVNNKKIEKKSKINYFSCTRVVFSKLVDNDSILFSKKYLRVCLDLFDNINYENITGEFLNRKIILIFICLIFIFILLILFYFIYIILFYFYIILYILFINFICFIFIFILYILFINFICFIFIFVLFLLYSNIFFI